MTHRHALTAAAATALALAVAAPASAARISFLQGEQAVTVERPAATPRAAVIALLAGPTGPERARGIRTQVPNGVPVRAVTVAGGVVTVDLGDRFARIARAEALNARLSQLVLTVDGLPGVRGVRVRIEGGTVYGLFPGVDLTRTVTARSIRTPDTPPPAPGGTTPSGPADGGTLADETRLAALGYLDPARADGVADAATRDAVIAFQKWERLGRDGVIGPQTRARLQTAVKPTPRASGDARRVEVLLDRQVALYVEAGAVARVLHLSSGKPGYETPAGTYRIGRKYTRDWSVPYSVWLPWASYFVGGVAFHESASVPVTPASHGCVRLPNGDARWLYDRTPVGTQVVVLRTSA
jgi:hypothetical protein